jgi:hypothetical protein
MVTHRRWFRRHLPLVARCCAYDFVQDRDRVQYRRLRSRLRQFRGARRHVRGAPITVVVGTLFSIFNGVWIVVLAGVVALALWFSGVAIHGLTDS